MARSSASCTASSSTPTKRATPRITEYSCLECGDGLSAFGQIGPFFMRELFEDVFRNEPLDPMEAARRNMRPSLRKRFYERAAVAKRAPYPVLLDERVVKTPAGNTLAAPTAPLAEI